MNHRGRESEPTPTQAGSPSSNGSNGSLNGCIEIRGARVHNLRNVDVDIPRDHLVVITGLSGSGKSSLAFDTLYAEGQRRYIESLSTYARQFLDQMERPDVDLIEGLQPTLSIDQRGTTQNPRSTVATVTEIYDHLRLLMARVGEATCYQCSQPIRSQTADQIVEELLSFPERTKCMILAPYVRGKKGQHKDVFEKIRKAGFVRARVDGEIYDLESVPELKKQKVHHIEAVIDRVLSREGVRARISDSIRLALRHTGPLVMVVYEESGPDSPQGEVWREKVFSTEYACPDCGISYEELEPRTFSFNSPYGACPECEGLGAIVEFDPDLVLPDTSLSMATGAIAPWADSTPAAEKKYRPKVASFLTRKKARWNTPLEKLGAQGIEQLLHGDKKFVGVLALLEKEWSSTGREARRQKLETFRGSVTCSVCSGARVRAEARSVRLADKAIHEITALDVEQAENYFAELSFEGRDALVAAPIVAEILGRLSFLRKVGLSYLTLDRAGDTLSGGESQRIRLASSIGSGLTGVCYVLDEPSIGLHPRDNDRLIDALRDLQQQGNTVIVVEHDEALMRRCDHLIDLGPGAGLHGGRLVAEGTPEAVSHDDTSLTGRYLGGHDAIPVPNKRRKLSQKRSIVMEGAAINNLKQIAVRVPLGALVCVTGVSGSGKSSLLNETLCRALVRKLGGVAPKPGPFTSLRGASQIERVIEVDQSPIGRTPRSNPATYAGLFDEIRKVFTATKQAKLRGYKVGRFSFNVKGGRCEDCQGYGLKRIEMNFLPDQWVTCDTCGGKRFNRQTLEVRYKGRSIADVLEMRVDEAAEFFENFPAVTRILATLIDVGLGYLTIGQPSTQLSGGEAQRIKLATELARTTSGNTMYILDEPTTGLHFEDVKNLLRVLDALVDRGNTVVVIEHHLDVIKSADWLIDLGPEGGDAGGQVMAEGTPEEVAAVEGNHTGRFLREVLVAGNGRASS